MAENVFGFTGEVKELSRAEGTWTFPERAMEICDRPSDNWWLHQFHVLLMYNTGSIQYYKVGIMSSVPNNLPSYEEAREIADNFIEKLKAYGLTPRNPNMRITSNEKVVIGAGSYRPAVEGLAEEENIIYYLNAGFYLSYENFKTWGPGADITVSVGENGEIVELQGFWRDVEQKDNVPVSITPEEALGALASEGYWLTGISPKEVHVTEIVLGYYCRAPYLTQDYLAPVYLFKLVDETGQSWTHPISVTGEQLVP